MYKNTNEPQRHVEFEFAPGNMKKACKGDLTWLNKTSIEVLEDGRLFTENDGLVEIYSNGFCVDIITSNALRSVSAIKCQHVKPSKNCTRKRDVPPKYVQSNSKLFFYRFLWFCNTRNPKTLLTRFGCVSHKN